MLAVRRSLLAFSLALGCFYAAPAQPARDAEWARLDFEIVDPSGKPIAGRLTVVPEDDRRRAVPLQPVGDASALAVRPGTVATRTGRGQVRLPPGRYRAYASRGPEWSVRGARFEARPGAPVVLRFELRHEIDTRGWTSADLHVHSGTVSGHGDATLRERVVTLLAEGVEVAVASDHNHPTDYGAILTEIQSGPELQILVGNEVSTPLGHFNIFPVEPTQKPAPNHDVPVQLFRRLREQTGAENPPVLVQINHPRHGVAAYFTQMQLDPTRATSQDPRYGEDFDALEVFNRSEAFGYPEDNTVQARGSPTVLSDWYNLLNRGHRYAAVGNSDSHSVREDPVGYPRNFIRTSADPGERPDASQLVEALRANRSFTTFGPFVELTVNGHPVGSEFATSERAVDIAIRVQAASWIDVDRVELVVNGDVVEEIPVPERIDPVRLDVRRSLELEADSWIAVQVEGDRSLWPIVPDAQRAVLPRAVTNPIWVHLGEAGPWISAWEQARQWVAALKKQPAETAEYFEVPPSQRALRILAAEEMGSPLAPGLVLVGAGDTDPRVRQAAARAAEDLALPRLVPALDRAFERAREPYERVAWLRALAAADPPLYRERILALARSTGTRELGPWASALGGRSPGVRIAAWAVASPFAQGAPDAPILASAPDSVLEGKGNRKIRWQKRAPGPDGFVDLRAHDAPATLAEHSKAYARVYLRVLRPSRIPIALGSDDGIAVYLGDRRVFQDPEAHRATPWQHFLELPLEPGWNRVTLAVTNGVGDSGFFFEILDDDVDTSIAPY